MFKNTFSFDIFDTLITRKTATPTGIFYLMAEILSKESRYTNLSKNFAELRVKAELNARQKSLEEEITLVAIYDELAILTGIDEKSNIEILELEIQTEEANALPINHNINKVLNLLNNDEHVILLSDMYLPENIVHRIISRICPELGNLKLYISSSINKTKSSGNMYKYVKIKENIQYKYWIHYGDNKHSDIEVATRYGIKTVYWNEELQPYEKIALKKANNSVSAQLIAGMARYCRMNINNSSQIYGSSLAPVFLIPYIDWILNECINKQIGALYFVARDGYVLKKIMDIFIKKRNLKIKTKYIYGSRKAWTVPSISSKDFSKITNFFTTSKSPSIVELSYNLELNEDILKSFLPNGYKNLDEAKKILENNEEFWHVFLNNTSELRTSIEQYLKQEIDFNDNFSFVEFRGTGKTQSYLGEICENISSKQIQTFYFSLLGNYTEKTDIKYTMNNNKYVHDILELFIRAPHGQTSGYKKENNIFVPILEPNEGPIAGSSEVWNFKNYLQGLTDYANNYDGDLNFDELFSIYYEYIIYGPDKKLATLFGSVPFYYNTDHYEYAPVLTLSNVVKTLRKPDFAIPWPAGLIRRNIFPTSFAISFMIILRKIFKFIIRIVK